MYRSFQKEKGYATFLSLAVLLSLSVLVISYLQLASYQLLALQQFQKTFQVSYNAESGVEDLISHYYNDILYDETLPNQFSCEGNASYQGVNGNINFSICIKDIPDSKIYTSVDCNYDNISENELTSRKILVTSSNKNEKYSSKVTSTLSLTKNACEPNVHVSVLNWKQTR